jgi:hypothetical protein
MATKILPSEYLGSNYSGDTSTGVVSFDVGDFVSSSGLSNAEVGEVSAIDPENLVTGLTYTITTLGDTDWESIGAPADADVGTTFTATGQAPSGTTGEASSGDIRRIMLGICEQMYQKYFEYSSAETAPLRMTVNRTTGINNPIGATTSLIVTYSIGFTVDIQSQEVTEE